MPTASRWGALVVASLPLVPAACSPTINTQATSPPAASAASAASAVASTSASPPRLSAFVDLSSADADPSRQDRPVVVSIATARFGRGTFTQRTYRLSGDRAGDCPVSGGDTCGSFSFRLDAAPAPGGLWTDIDPTQFPPPVAVDDRAAKGPFAAPHAWVAFAGGRDAVYALREGGTHIDRIDDQGKVTPFASDPAMAGWNDLWVIEMHDRFFVAGMGPTEPKSRTHYLDDWMPRSDWQLVEVLPGTSGQPRRLGPATSLPMRPMSQRASAQGARTASQDGKMAAVRLPQLVALPDEGDEKDRWAMAWLEVIPPAYGWPNGRPQKGVSASPTAPRTAVNGEPAKKGARHGCGGPGSRDLEDASVTKRAHVTRFAGTKMVDDQVRWTGANVGDVDAVKLAPRVEGAEIAVAMPTRLVRTHNSPWSDGPPPPGPHATEMMPLLHDEQIRAVGYDPASREGIVVVRDGERDLFRLFDASGTPAGDAVDISPKLDHLKVARIDGKWMALGASPVLSLYNLSDGTGPFLLPSFSFRNSPQFVPAAGGGGAILYVNGTSLLSLSVGPEGVRGDPVTVEEIPSSYMRQSFHAFATGATPTISFVEPREQTGNDKVAWRSLAPGAAWQHTELLSQDITHVDDLLYRPLLDDVALLDRRRPSGGVTWLRAGKSFQQPPAPDGARAPAAGTPDESIASGPLLGHALRLPATPGLPTRDEETAGLGKTCQHSVMTGPGTIVAVCVHPTDAMTPSLRVALRTLHVESTR